ncbi:hypothetical protein B0J18DRAFT_244429 [Chaetomium sp. MPI-SDFR-AT-0129]|nr:hypothetical protein B0J18DRAFT_244429 [Chaetomium sp. MPI-SDFR-AT-0129]
MKVIITGCTGLVGSGLVRQAIANDQVSHVFALTRKPLDDAIAKSPKVTVILHDDFSSYPSELLSQLAGADVCLWAIGGRANQFPDVETYRKISVDYTLAAANAFREHLTHQLPNDKQFRFVFCSGKYAEWDQTKALRFMADTRHIKGQVEKGLCDIADNDTAKRFIVYCGRPSGILPPNAGLASKLTGKLYAAIDVDHLARGLLRVALEGHKERIIENDSLLAL